MSHCTDCFDCFYTIFSFFHLVNFLFLQLYLQSLLLSFLNVYCTLFSYTVYCYVQIYQEKSMYVKTYSAVKPDFYPVLTRRVPEVCLVPEGLQVPVDSV